MLVIVESKSRFGDLEFDTVIGAKHHSALVSVVDRASKITWLSKILRTTANQVNMSLKERLGVLGKRGLLKSSTSDNGREFSRHKEFSRELDCPHYFARPYHSWERGLNEHTNGLVRQYLPK